MKTYIMRWNPAISSYKLETFRKDISKWPDGFQIDWSIYEWEDAKEGDAYIMVRVGEEPNGVVFSGIFLSDPYENDDWAGTSKKRYYVDMTVDPPFDPNLPSITAERLEAILPEIDWRKGHSGQLMTKEQECKFWDAFADVLNAPGIILI